MTAAMAILIASPVLPPQWSGWLHQGSIAGIIAGPGGVVICATSGGVAFGTLGAQGVSWDSSWTYPARMPHPDTRCLATDAYGNIWAGTWGGGIEVFSPDGSQVHYGQLEGLPVSLEISSIHPDTAVYAGTSEGLAVKVYGYFQLWTELSTGGGLPDDQVLCLAPADTGLFVGTQTGVAMLSAGMDPGSPSSWVQFAEMEGMTVRALAWGGDTLWAATDGGLYMLADSAWRRDPTFPGSSASCISVRGDSILAGSGSQVAFRAGGTWTALGVYSGQFVRSVAWAPDGRIMAGLVSQQSTQSDTGRGLAVRVGGYWSLSAPQGIPANDIRSVTVDASGRCWITTLHAGAAVLLDGAWVEFRDSLPSEHQVFASESQSSGVLVAPYHSGAVWIDCMGTPDPGDDSILVLDSSGGGLLNDQVTAMDRLPGGPTWMAQEPFFQTPGEPSGVVRLDWVPGDVTSAEWASWTPSDGLPSAYVNAVCGLPDGGCWAGTDDGLARLGPDPGEVAAVLTEAQGLPSAEVTELLLARNGIVVAGTAAGAAAVQPGAQTATTLDGVEGPVGALAEDFTGSIWLAGDLLYRIGPDGSTEEYGPLNSPLLGQDIHDMAVDAGEGLLYLATGYGLWVVDVGTGTGGDGGGAAVYPNPFRPGDGEVLGVAGIPDAPTTIRVFDLSGVLVYECSSPDRDALAWGGLDSGGSGVPSGIYIVEVSQDGLHDTVKLAVVR